MDYFSSDIPSLPNGTVFSARNKLGTVSYYEMLGLYYETYAIKRYVIRAVGETRRLLNDELKLYKSKNPEVQSIQDLTEADFATYNDIEAEWFYQRIIKVLDRNENDSN